MAATPTYEGGTKRVGQAILNNASGTTVTAAVLTGAAGGTRVKEIRVHSGPTTAPGTPKLVVIRDDGTNQTVIAIVSIASTVDIEQTPPLRFDNLTLPTASYSIKLAMRTAIASGGTVHVSIDGVDY